MIKQDISIYVSYSWQNDWTEWADIFLGNPGVSRGYQPVGVNLSYFKLRLFDPSEFIVLNI